MTDSLDDLERKVQSESKTVLRQSLQFAYRCREREVERGKSVEARATAVLGILGLIATLAASQAGALKSVYVEAQWLVAAVYISSLAFLIKALYFAMGVLRARMVNRVDVDSVFELDESDSRTALRKELAWVIWETKALMHPNGDKLWCLDRSQRNGFIGIVSLALFGIAVLVVEKGTWNVHPCLVALFVIVAIAVWILEKRYFNRIPWSHK